MAKYTIELRNICDIFTRPVVESWFKDYELTDYLTDEEIAVIAARGTWSKDKLAQKIVDRFYMLEIGYETPALFKHMVKVKMNEIMESKLPLIYSAAIEYDPLVNVDYTETFTRQATDTGQANASGLTITSDTPQGQINKNEILTGKYASNTQGGESTNATNSQSNETSSRRMKGNSGVSATAQKMVLQYRENIRAIDYEIINELKSLFMGLY